MRVHTIPRLSVLRGCYFVTCKRVATLWRRGIGTTIGTIWNTFYGHLCIHCYRVYVFSLHSAKLMKGHCWVRNGVFCVTEGRSRTAGTLADCKKINYKSTANLLQWTIFLIKLWRLTIVSQCCNLLRWRMFKSLHLLSQLLNTKMQHKMAVKNFRHTAANVVHRYWTSRITCNS